MVRAITSNNHRVKQSQDSLNNYPHGLRVLMGQQGQQGSEAAQPSSEENKERKFLLWINRNLVKHGE